MTSNNFFPLANAYRTYGRYDPPGPGVDPVDAPLANHIVESSTEADEIDYPVEGAYRMSIPMYDSQIAPYPPPPTPSLPPAQPVGVNYPPRPVREHLTNIPPEYEYEYDYEYADPPGPETPTAPPFYRPPNYQQKSPPPNNVLDYNKLQGTQNPTDLSTQILRDPNYRYITLQNSSYRPVGIGITTYYTGTVPSVRFILEPGLTRYLGINSQGEAAQYVWLLDPETGNQVGSPQILSAASNDFVVRDGINGWTVQNFTRPSYRAAF